MDIELPVTGGMNGSEEEQRNFPLLRVLTLSQNLLPAIKLNNFLLPNLETLNFDTNQITKIEGFPQAKLKKLQSLSLQSNRLAEINLTNASLDSLTYLDLRENVLVRVLGLETLKNLRSLDMNKNNITEIVWNKASLEEVTTINLMNNRLTMFDAFSLAKGVKWRDLVHLNLTSNDIVEVDLEGCSLSLLKTIVMPSNQIRRVKLGKSVFPELTLLDFHSNKITDFEGLPTASLKKLEEINLDSNHLEKFSLRGVTLPELQTLELRQNRISEIMLQGGTLPKLRNLLFTEGNLIGKLNMSNVLFESLEIIHF